MYKNCSVTQSVLLSDDTGGQTYKFQTYRCSWLPNKQQRKCPHIKPTDKNLCISIGSSPILDALIGFLPKLSHPLKQSKLLT